MKIVTTETITNTPITDVKGAVFNEQVISINIMKDIISGFKGIFGGKSETYSNEYSKGREIALEELQKQSRELGANTIVDVKVNFNQFINSDIMLIVVTASGTAVVT